MRPSLRFLALAMIGWGGIRAATLGEIPGASVSAAQPISPAPMGVAQTQFAEIAPLVPAPTGIAPMSFAPASIQMQAGSARPIVIPVYYAYQPAPAAPIRPARYTPILPEPAPRFYAPIPALDEWPLSRIAASSMPPARSQTTAPMQTTAPALVARRLDRLQLTMWAMLRGRQGDFSAPTSLASGGTLGASQAGARLFYNVTPAIAAVLRTSSTIGRRGGEVALGARVQPLRAIPLWVTAERRQRLGRYGGGRNAFALFAEGGVYDQPLPRGFLLDGYAQGGVVGLGSRDLFADGGFTITHPIYREFSAGFGLWGGVQPGLYRVDAGPRLTMKVRRNVRVHLDWRQRLVGNARPGSGPALTLASDF